MAVTSGAAGRVFVAPSDSHYRAIPLQVYSALSNPARPARATPTVSVVGDAGGHGGFVVGRTGAPLDGDLPVTYHVGGSAVGGGDYGTLSGQVTIPTGQGEAVIGINLLPGADRNRKVKVFVDPAPDGSYAVGKAQSKVFLSDLP